MANEDIIAELEATKNDLLKRAAQIDEAINTMRTLGGLKSSAKTPPITSVSSQKSNVPDDYPVAAPIRLKLAYVLKKSNKFLHIRQIAEILHEIEPETDASSFITKLYPAIADLKKSGSIVKFSVDSTNINSFWGSKNWLDSNGQIKPEHNYDEDQVKSYKSDGIDI